MEARVAIRPHRRLPGKALLHVARSNRTHRAAKTRPASSSKVALAPDASPKGLHIHSRDEALRYLRHGAKVAVIRGTPEARGGNVIVRDLLKKEQRVTRLAAVVTEVGRHVPKHQTPPLYEGPPPNSHEQEPGAAGEAPYLKDDRD